MAVIGLDVGSTQAKCGVYGCEGRLINVFTSEYPIFRDKEYQYADSNAMWQSVKRILALAASGNNIEGICVTSFGESFAPVDKNGNILDNIMLYTDARGAIEAEELKGKISESEVFEISGNIVHSMYSLPKMMWLKRHRAQVYKNAAYLLPVASFITYMLSGEAAVDYSLAARTMALDIDKYEWSDRLLSLADVDKSKLPKAVESGRIIGSLKKELSAELGIAADCRIVSGGHDQVCSGLGAGVLTAGSSVDGIGTTECITPVFNSRLKGKNAIDSGFSCIPYAVKGLYATYMFNYSGGALVKWFRDKLVPENTAALKQRGMSFYEYYEGNMPASPTGLLVLPHFNGAATPYMDLSAKGAVLNMDINTSAFDIFKGILEGCTYEMRLNLDYGEKSGIKVSRLTATGGGANSKAWLQIKADIMGVPVYPLESADAGIAGCAMLALNALGKVKDLSEAAGLIVREGEPYLPSRERAEKYDEIYEKYKKIYELVKEVR